MTTDGPIYEKFLVARTDGSTDPGGRHENCFHFVLDIDHDPYAIPALQAYADAARATHPQLARSIDCEIIQKRVESEGDYAGTGGEQ